MKGMRALILIATTLLATAGAALGADIKIGFVNAAKILDKAPQSESANNRLKQEFAPREKSLIEAQRALRKLEESLQLEGETMSDSQRRKLEREIIAQRRELKRSQDEFREDVNIRRNEELGKLQRLVFDAINQLAKEEGFDLIVNDGAVIYASEQVDITDKVLLRLSQ